MNKELSANTSLSHYRIVSKIGAGGMGEVYLAQDTKLDRKVALKILPSEFAEDKDRMSRFVREAKSASALNHPNILTIHEINEFDGTHFIATEFIDGKTLNEFAKSNPLNFKATLEIAIQIASALDEAHAAGIVHRDIKPDNVMVRANGLVKILDFGIAKLIETRKAERGTLNEEAATLVQNIPPSSFSPHPSTSPGMIIGTANYMSPEQAKGIEIDARTDIFSFGVVLYEIVARQLPFEGETVMEMIGAILKDEPKSLEAEVPTEISKIISKCLRKDRDERYQTIKDVGNDLQDVKQDLEFQNKLEKTISSEKEEPKTQILAAPTNETLASKPKLNKWLAAALAGMLAIGGFFGYRNFTTTNQIESIAVMPFVNASGNAEVEYLSDGMTETLISSLSQLPKLNVKARSSVFRYKGKEFDLPKIAHELNVQAILTGRVVQRGDQLTLSLELVSAQTENAIWSEQYNRQQTDLVTLQSEIARDVSSKLKAKLSGADEQKLTKTYTANPEAYQLYLKGRFYWNKRTKDDILKGIDYFQQVIKLDPNYALAYATIADSYNSLGKNADLPPKEVLPQAKAAATRALEIDPTLAEAHGALADSLALYDWNWAESEREYGKAFQLDPNVSYIHLTHGVSYFAPLGKRDEAVAELKRAVELEPLSLITNAIFGLSYLYAGQNDKALEQGKRTYDLDPNFRFGRQYLGNTLIVLGRYDEATALAEEGLKTSPLSQEDLVIAGLAYAKSGRRREAEQYLDRFRELAKTRYVRTVFTASIYAALGDKDKAFAELEKSFENKDCFLPRIKLDPFMDSLRNDPRYKDLLKRMGLPE